MELTALAGLHGGGEHRLNLLGEIGFTNHHWRGEGRQGVDGREPQGYSPWKNSKFEKCQVET